MQLIRLEDYSNYSMYGINITGDSITLITLSKVNGTITTIHGELLPDVVETELYCCYKRDNYPNVINL